MFNIHETRSVRRVRETGVSVALFWRMCKDENDLRVFMPGMKQLLEMVSNGLSTKRRQSQGHNHIHSLTELCRWCPPSSRLLKYNVNSSLFEYSEKCGVGWVLRDGKSVVDVIELKPIPFIIN